MKRYVSLCAWCPRLKRWLATFFAHAAGRTITHGICPACSRRLMIEARTIAYQTRRDKFLHSQRAARAPEVLSK